MEQLAWTVQETMERTRIGRNELYRAINAGELKVVKIGRRIVIPVESVKRWLEERAGVSA
ncbi:MAG: helix-turn-helix domain-containing protein [Actinomycetota bacterium]